MITYSGPGRTPLPDFYFTKLRYQDWVNVASGGAGANDIVYRGNSPRDPLSDSGGIGCPGYDELAAIYQQYRVFGSKIRVSFKGISDATATGDGVLMIIPDRSSTDYTISTMRERQQSPYAQCKMFHRFADKSIVMKSFRRTKDIMGEKDLDDDDYASAVTTDPVKQWYWHVIAGRGDQSAISAYPGYQYLIQITYYVRFERRTAIPAPTT